MLTSTSESLPDEGGESLVAEKIKKVGASIDPCKGKKV